MIKRHLRFKHVVKLTRPIEPVETPERPVVMLDEDGIRRLEQRLPYDSAVSMVKRLREGHRCYAIQNQAGEVESFNWVIFGGEVYVYSWAAEIQVPEEVAYFYDGFTFPEGRGKGLIGQVVRGAIWDLKQYPVQRCETWIVAGNKASLRAFYKSGFEVYGSWRLLALGPVRFSRGEPWIGERG